MHYMTTTPADRTYSFRAPAELQERLAAARAAFTELAERAPDADQWLARELEMALARRLREAPAVARDQSAFIRAAVELLVGVTEKVALGLDLAERYSAARADDAEAEAFHRGAAEAAAATWRRDEA